MAPNKKILISCNQDENKFLNISKDLFTIKNTGNFEWYFNNEKINCSKNLNPLYLAQMQSVLLKVKKMGPLFSRHYDDLPSMELNYRKVAITIIGLASYLRQKSISIILFPFSSNHWIEGFILEAAGELIGAKLVFLYPTQINYRLLPFVQTNGIESRRVISFKFSNYKLNSETLHSIEKTIAKTQPHLNPNKYLPYTLITKSSIIVYYLKKKLISMKIQIKFPRKLESDIKNFGLNSELKVFNNQTKAINYYLKLVKIEPQKLSSSVLKSKKLNDLSIVIYASFQPETTAFPEGGKWNNIIDVVAEIKASGYKGDIFFKEHPNLISSIATITKYPNRIGVARNIDFYNQLKELGCYFTNEKYLDYTSFLALTITGSIAIERSLVNKKTIVTGHPWFAGLPGTITLHDFLYNKTTKNKFLKNSKIQQPAHQFIETCLNMRSMSNILDQEMYQLNFSAFEKSVFIRDFNNLIKSLHKENL